MTPYALKPKKVLRVEGLDCDAHIPPSNCSSDTTLPVLRGLSSALSLQSHMHTVRIMQTTAFRVQMKAPDSVMFMHRF
jgi:hypothetical protein